MKRSGHDDDREENPEPPLSWMHAVRAVLVVLLLGVVFCWVATDPNGQPDRMVVHRKTTAPT